MALSPVFHEIDDSAKMIYLSQYCTSINNIVSVKWSPKSNVLSIGLKFRGFLIILTNIRHAICAIQNMCNLQSKCLLALVCTAPLDTWSMKLLLLLQMCWDFLNLSNDPLAMSLVTWRTWVPFCDLKWRQMSAIKVVYSWIKGKMTDISKNIT